jgi:hypothetical protein
MKLRVLLPMALSLVVLAAVPVSTVTHAMSLIGGVAKTDSGLITAIKDCHHIRNRHQRQLCLHPKKPKRRAGREN